MSRAPRLLEAHAKWNLNASPQARLAERFRRFRTCEGASAQPTTRPSYKFSGSTPALEQATSTAGRSGMSYAPSSVSRELIPQRWPAYLRSRPNWDTRPPQRGGGYERYSPPGSHKRHEQEH